MPHTYHGQCLCGAVSLDITSEPVAVLSCFCQHCSKGAGGTNQIASYHQLMLRSLDGANLAVKIAKFPSDSVALTIAPDSLTSYTFQDTSSGQSKEKAFCKHCGVPLWTVPASAKGQFLLIRTAILDDGLQFKPGNEIFTKYRPAWAKGTEGVTQWAEMRK